MGRSRFQRSWPALEPILERYFSARGDPSLRSVIDPSPHVPHTGLPANLERICAVGVAMAKLTEEQRSAVFARWAHMGEAEYWAARALNRERASRWTHFRLPGHLAEARSAKECRELAGFHRRERRRIERLQAYQVGMAALDDARRAGLI